MSFGNIVGQLLQQGMGRQGQTRDRLQHAAGQSGGGLDSILGGLMGGGGTGGGSGSGGLAGLLGGGGTGGSTGSGGLGDLAGMAQSFLGGKQAGGMSGGQIGGLGALVGAVLGGGTGAAKGALGGGAMAILGTMALSALKNYQAQGSQAQGAAGGQAAAPVRQEEIEAVTDPATERLVLRAMIAAAKADGRIDQTEMQQLVGRIEPDGVSEAERQFMVDEMTRTVGPAELAAEVRSPAVAAEVYAASLLAIDIDTEEERDYLRRLAQAMRLDAGTVQRLHQMTGAPAV